MKNSVCLKSVLLCTLIGASFMSENGYASSLVEPFPVAVRESTQDYVSHVRKFQNVYFIRKLLRLRYKR